MDKNQQEIAYLGGGCFWCLEALFKRIPGVVEVISGYMGGKIENPSYEEVCEGNTGHAEIVQVTFNSEQIDYNDILNLFFSFHDPTTLNRQGNDVGTQYRSVIFYVNEEQKIAAQEEIQSLKEQNIFPDKIVTEVVAKQTFYPAEEYHQDYFDTHKNVPYCTYVINPKVRKLEQILSNKKS
ncbi:peptide-methionine (S)-S-oxide reductase MsrA [Neisseriaceae bacterium PsAf]|nr:peptide-methionine (S)-S-oxide reductase MsrA [Neisseriaceae bacterium PsAf]MCV2503897.1 peptide-methionine (S)-S-oxide reductase MsrA [Neisseriaceae bacterium]